MSTECQLTEESRVKMTPTMKHYPIICRELIQKTPSSARDWHKEMLMSLFLRSQDSELCQLSKKLGKKRKQSFTRQISTSNNKKRQTTGGHAFNPFIPGILTKFNDCTVLDILPYAIRNNKVKNKSMNQNCRSSISMNLPKNCKRQSFLSQQLGDLEQQVLMKFEKSLSFEPDISSKRRKICDLPDEKKTENKQEDSSGRYIPISLQYNECSLAAISKWSARSSDAYKSGTSREYKNVTDSNASFFRPSPSVFFRKCSVCQCWGHYEIECEQASSKDILKLSSSIKIQQTLRQFVEEDNATNNQIQETRNRNNLGWTKVETNFTEESEVLNEQEIVDLDFASNEISQNSFGRRNQSVNLDDEYLTRSTACSICDSGFHGEDLLLCDGCDGLFHRQCLDPPLSSVPEGDWFCSSCASYDSDVSSVVEVEGCEGFVIEQRKRSMAEYHAYLNEKNLRVDFPEDSWSAAVMVVKKDDTTKDFSPVQERSACNEEKSSALPSSGGSALDSSRDERSHINLSPGDLCWAKRKTATVGKLARDDWWPAMVIQVTESKVRKKNRSIILTPYVVKLYALPGAGRVRASDVLPFFPHYEDLGQKRIMFKRGQHGYNEFKKALEESLSDIGYNNLGQALKKAREMKFAGKSEEISINHSSLQLAGKKATTNSSLKGNLRPSEWDDADASQIDDIVILTKNKRKTETISWQNNNEKDDSFNFNGVSRNIGQKSQENVMLFTRKEPLPPPHKLMGSIVAWSIKQSAQIIKNADDSTGSSRNKNHFQLQMGAVTGINNNYQKLLVRCLPSLKDIFSTLATAKIQATYDDNLNEENSIKIHSCSLGPSLWVSNRSVIHISDGPTRTVKEVCNSTLSESLAHAKDIIRSRILDEATKREENTVELVSRPPSANISSGQSETEEQLGVTNDRDTTVHRGRRMLPGPVNNSSAKGSSTKLASVNVRSIQTKRNSGDKKNKKNTSEGIFVAERILNQRNSVITNNPEYLIKWRGFRDEDSTWEPIENIYDQSLVRMFSIERLLQKLKACREAEIPGSITKRMIKNVEVGLKQIGEIASKQDKSKSRACPFCNVVLRDGSAFGGHVKTHSKEPNYKLLREAYKAIIDENWSFDF